MKQRLITLGLATLLTSTAWAKEDKTDFAGAQPQPIGLTSETVSQLRVRFPKEIEKSQIQGDAFKVNCKPEVEGFEGWADNNTLWTFNFKAKGEYDSPKLSGGSKCQITQEADVTAKDGTVWSKGTINYAVTLSGPNVTDVTPAYGFSGNLREADPVVLIQFDGPVNKAKFFAEQNAYLGYLSSNAPAEKMFLKPVPTAQEAEIFSHFKRTQYVDVDLKDQNWILGTVAQGLIPGSQVNLTIQNQTSLDNADVHSTAKFDKEFSVRSRFEAEIQCASPSANNATCMPNSPISVAFNGMVKWADVKDAYIEYVPYKSTDGKKVRSYAELGQDQDAGGYFNMFMNKVGEYISYAAKFSDTRVESLTFNVKIEPQTQAKVVLPQNLIDIDGRKLSNAIAEFHLRIGAMAEVIQVPQAISFFEKNVPKLYLPVGLVNLNQKLSIRKTGTNSKNWEPTRDVAQMIRLIRSYEIRGDYRNSPTYQSPLEALGLKTTVTALQMTGHKNRPTFLQFPFGKNAKGEFGGMYPIEVSSPSFEKGNSDQDSFYNPKFVLAQVTNLAVHLKKGETSSVAWVTQLDSAQPVNQAQVDIYNCLGQKVQTLQTNASGLVSFPNQEWAKDCQAPQRVYSQYFDADQFYAVAKANGDIALTHSSWSSPNSYAMFAPGVEYYYSDISENTPHFHSIVDVNLVKPGQKVPVQLVAKLPNAKGFSEVQSKELPPIARVANADDENTYYEFPLTWVNGTAQFVWTVPMDQTVKLGRYSIELRGGNLKYPETLSSGDIEVAEFKIPLMSGLISFPTQQLVKPDSIPASSIIRYANGVGAKNVAADLSYYFEPTSIRSSALADFAFGSGPVKLIDQDGQGRLEALPTNSRPARIEGLSTGQDGTLSRDIALENAADGRTIAEVLKTMERPQTLVVRVRYQDQMGEYQTLSQAKDLFNATEYVGTRLISGERSVARLQVASINVDQKNTTSLANLDLKVFRVETKVIGEELFGGLIKNTVERELKPVRWVPSCSQQAQGQAQGQSPAQKQKFVSCAVGDLKSGSYAFQVTSKSSGQAANVLFKVDEQGRVYGNDDYYQFGDDEGNKQLPLALNKKMYKHGEEAIVSFPAPFKQCRALVTLERSDVMQAFVVNDACQKGQVTVPVNADYAPNAFVSVYAITGRADNVKVELGEKDLGRPTYRLGYANLKVDWSHFASDVTVKTDKEKYEPGDQVAVEVHVTPQEGALLGGQVTFVAIEEKILELKKNNTYNILDALMQLRAHNVQTVTPLEKVETVTADNADLPADDVRKGGDEGGDGSSKSEFKRKLFDALVAYQAGVPVKNGVARFTFKTNDSLTRFRVFAIATDSAQKFGMGSVVYLTEKDTQAYSNIPSVAHTGDKYPLKVTIQNNSSTAHKYRAEITATIKDSSGRVIGTKKLSKDVTIGNQNSSAVDVGQLDIGAETGTIEYVVRVYDENGNLVDVMEPAPQVVLPTVPLQVHDSYIVQLENGALHQNLLKEPTALLGQGEVRVTVSKSLVTGAVEQILKRMDQDQFADFFIESRIYKALLNSSPSRPEKISAALATLLGYTDSNGFVKYYPQAQNGSVWLTARLLNVLQQEPWALKLAPQALIEKLNGAVSQVLTKSVDPMYIDGKSPMSWMQAQALMGRAAFAFDDESLKDSARAVNQTLNVELAGNPDVFGRPMEKWTANELVNFWMLGMFTAPDQALASTAYQKLIGPQHLNYTGNLAELTGSPSFGYFYQDETINTSDLLLGTAMLKGDADLARALSLGLVNASTKSWYNASTMVSVAQSLKAFSASYESQRVTGSALINVVEQNASKTVAWDKSQSAELRTPWTNQKASVEVTQAGQGRPWVGVQALTAVPLTSARGQGLEVEKSMRNVTRDSGFQTGDIIEVTVKIHASNRLNHVALMDPIPAGSNILGDAYGDQTSGEKSYSGYKLYFEELAQGTSSVKYQYQLNNPGQFKLPPTRAEGLYMPGVYGEAPNARLTVQ